MKRFLLVSLVFLFCLTGCSLHVMDMDTLEADSQGESSELKADRWQDIKPELMTRLNTTSPDAYENDDTSAAANWITPNAAEQEHNYYDDATDWLKFTAAAGVGYTLESWVVGSGDTKLYLYNSSLTQLAYNDDKGDGTYGSKITWSAPAAGTYYIKSASYADRTGTNRGYTISVVGGGSSSGDAYEDDDTMGTASTITNGQVQSHDFSDDAVDYVKFYGQAGYSYRLESTVDGADTVFYLYNASGTELADNDDGGSGLASLIMFVAPSNGYYYLRINSYGDRIGTGRNYTVTMTETEPSSGEPKTWTVMVYLDADNNLDSFGVSDVNEMTAVGSSNDINVIVLWDDYYGSRHGYYYINQGAATLVQDLGEINMGAQSTLTNFINFAVENYPADKYFLDLWNHGGGPDRSLLSARGVAWDDTNGGDHLSEVELKAAMDFFYNKIGRKVDLIGFDACLMASAEIAYQFRNTASYMVASEETEPGDGWDYSFLQALKNNPSMNGLSLGYEVFDSYSAWYSAYSGVTFSVLDLSLVDELEVALDNFCSAAISSGTSGTTFRNQTSGVADFSGYTKDIWDYMNNISGSSSFTSTVRSRATSVKTAVDNMVKYEWHGSSFNNGAYGVSIVMKADTSVYSQLDICAVSQWDEFLTFCGF